MKLRLLWCQYQTHSLTLSTIFHHSPTTFATAYVIYYFYVVASIGVVVVSSLKTGGIYKISISCPKMLWHFTTPLVLPRMRTILMSKVSKCRVGRNFTIFGWTTKMLRPQNFHSSNFFGEDTYSFLLYTARG